MLFVWPFTLRREFASFRIKNADRDGAGANANANAKDEEEDAAVEIHDGADGGEGNKKENNGEAKSLITAI